MTAQHACTVAYTDGGIVTVVRCSAVRCRGAPATTTANDVVIGVHAWVLLLLLLLLRLRVFVVWMDERRWATVWTVFACASSRTAAMLVPYHPHHN